MIQISSILKPEEKMKLFHALFVLKNNHETAPVIEWFESELSRLDRLNRTEFDQNVFRQRQGVCQAIENFLTECDRAKDQFVKVEGQSHAMRKGSIY